MALNLLPSDKPAWAYGGVRENITPEKWRVGWTGSASDYAFAAWINEILYQLFTDNNTIARTTNKLMQISATPYNALFEYPQDALMTFNNKLYIARKPNSGQPPTGNKDDENWQIITGIDWATEQLALKANIESPTLTGTPTTPTPETPYANQKQITNVEMVLKEANARVRGDSIIDLSSKDIGKAYPVLFAKDGRPTDTTISRDKGDDNNESGNMRFVLRGIGSGAENKVSSYYEVIVINDTSGAKYGKYIKKIESKAGNTAICVWLRGGLTYKCNQRLSEALPIVVDSTMQLENNWVVSMESWQDETNEYIKDGVWQAYKCNQRLSEALPIVVDSTMQLENNWVVSMESWQDETNEYIKDGVWQADRQESFTLDYSSISDSGSVETCGMCFMYAGTEPPAGALMAVGQEVSRATYSKLFSKIGSRYGAGDGSTTFVLPDLRGMVMKGIDLNRGIDSNQLVTAAKGLGGTNNRREINGVGSTQTMKGIDLNRGIDSNQLVTAAKGLGGTNNRREINGVGSTQTDAIRNITGTFGNGGADGFGIFYFGNVYGAFNCPNQGLKWTGGLNANWDRSNQAHLDCSRVVPIASKNQVDNIALLGCIYYL